MKLDVSSLPTEGLYSQAGGEIDLAEIVLGLRPTIDEWMRTQLVEQTDSFGFAIANPAVDTHDEWDNPGRFVWFVVGWGPASDRYIANAVRKLRPALRWGEDTLDMRINRPHAFINIVKEQEEDGSFEWGDFPKGGATFVRVGGLILPCSVSCFKEVEDDAVAKTCGGHTGATMLKLLNSEEFA
jgi:hypothetical protein